ncbi:MAG: FAD-dependent oxidoreductase [Gemmatimonadales bacterium]
MTGRLVLLGAGHAHLFVLEGLAKRPLRGVETTLISLDARQAYSGMVPGMIGGRYELDELSFDLPAICRRAGVTFLQGGATRLIPVERRVVLDAGTSLVYDLLSITTGSTVEGGDLPGVAEHALCVKPIGRAVEIVPALERAARLTREAAVIVVGGGAAGVEMALAARARLRMLGRVDASVTLIESEARLFGGRTPAAEGPVTRALAANRVTLRLGAKVSEVLADAVRLEPPARALPANVTIWAAGAAAAALLRDSGLALDERGFLLVDDRLRSVSDAAVFAAGDAATLERYPGTPKAGVYAVREGPVLWENLQAAARGDPPGVRYRPQPRFLALLNTGDGRAIVSYGRVSAWGRWAMTVKDRIDRSFMRRFHRLQR